MTPGEDGVATSELDALSILAVRTLMYSSSSARFRTARAWSTRHAKSCAGVIPISSGPVHSRKVAMRSSPSSLLDDAGARQNLGRDTPFSHVQRARCFDFKYGTSEVPQVLPCQESPALGGGGYVNIDYNGTATQLINARIPGAAAACGVPVGAGGTTFAAIVMTLTPGNSCSPDYREVYMRTPGAAARYRSRVSHHCSNLQPPDPRRETAEDLFVARTATMPLVYRSAKVQFLV
jgi:hypothetical protein